MANSVTAGTTQVLGSWTPLSGSEDVGTNPSAIILAVTGDGMVGPITWGGVTLSLWASGSFLGWDAYIYGALNPGISGSQALSSGVAGGNNVATPYVVNVNGSPALHSPVHGLGQASGAGDYTVDTADLFGFTIVAAETNFYAGVPAGMTLDYGGASGGNFAHETSITDGSRSVGINIAAGAAAGVTIVGGDVGIEPDRIGAEVGFIAGLAVGLDGPAVIQPNRVRGIEVGFVQGLRMGGTTKRQVALVGPEVAPGKFTPEMTVGGTEGQVLVQHEDRPPSWADPDTLTLTKRWEPVRFDSDGDDYYDEWLFGDDGDIIMLEVSD